jgi:hypothetical protein
VPGLPQGSGVGAYPTPPAPPVFTCVAPDVFTTCLITFDTPPTTPTDEIFVSFSGTGATDPGIAPGEHFVVNLNDGNILTGDVGTWNTVDAGTFDTLAIDTSDGPIASVPEPSMTWVLAAGCLIVFGLSVRVGRRKRQPQQAAQSSLDFEG